MSQSFKVLFFLKQGIRTKENALPIYIRVTTNGVRTEWSIQRTCDPSKWIQKAGRANGTKEEIKSLNAYLDAVHGQVQEIQKEATLRNEIITSQEVRSKILHKDGSVKQQSLLGVFDYHNKQFEKLVGLEFSNGTYKKFKVAYNSIQSFIAWKYKKKDISMLEVNHEFITSFEFYLKTEKKQQHNTAMSNIKKLKKIVRLSIANDWLSKDPFKSYKITMKETQRNFLLQEDLDTLMNKNIAVIRLDQVRDIFVFSCYTGLSYADVMLLTPHDISIGIDGGQWIFTTRLKTGTDSRIPLLPIAKSVLDKYANHPKLKANNMLLPKLSNQKLNSYLKEIGDICGFHKDLTFHCARHTFATTVTLTNGVPIETVGKMLGHKSLRTTQIYAKILDTKVSEDMQALRNRLNPKVKVIAV